MEKKRHALRKLLEAVEKELLQKPNRKTLDRLSLLAGFQDWDSFQEALHGGGDETVYGGHNRPKDHSPNKANQEDHSPNEVDQEGHSIDETD